MIRKNFGIEIKGRNADGGSIRITSPDVDRDNDRVFPELIEYRNWQKLGSPIFYGHEYRDPYQLIGKANGLRVSAAGIDADFSLRQPETDHDPQHVVRANWKNGLLNGASIGFRPLEMPKENEHGGLNFGRVELLEFSLTPIPAQQNAVGLSFAGMQQLAPLAKNISEARLEMIQNKSMDDNERRALLAAFAGLEKMFPDLARILS